MTSSIEQEANDSTIAESIGARFQQERRNQHKTLEEVAEATCIHISTLKALEADAHDQLPAMVFVKGFIKIYAKYLGLDQEESLSHYEPPTPEEVVNGSNPIYYQEILTTEEKKENQPVITFKRVFLIVLIFMIIIVLYTGSRILVSDVSEPQIDINQPNTESVEPTASEDEDVGSLLQPAAPQNDTTAANIENTGSSTARTDIKEKSAVVVIEKEIVPTLEPAPAAPTHISELPATDNQIKLTKAPAATPEKASEYVDTTDSKMALIDNIQPTANQMEQDSQEVTFTILTPGDDEPVEKAETAAEIVIKTQEIPTTTDSTISQPLAATEPTILSLAPRGETIVAPIDADDNINQEADIDFAQILVAEFIEPTWLKVQIDKTKARQYTYQPGSTRTWRAHDRIKIHLGNAGGAILTLNGTQLPSPGKSGRTARITIPDDYQ